MSVRFENIQNIKEFWEKHQIQIGFPVIDLQHLWLLSLIVNIENSKNKEISVDDLKFYLLSLTEFISDHFSLEEKLLELIYYPKLKEHIKSHRRYTEQIKNLYQNGMNDIYSLSDKIHYILNKWLIDHIKVEDKEYKDYLFTTDVDIDELNKTLIREANISRNQAYLYNKIVGTSNVHNNINKNVLEGVKNIWKTYDLSIKIPIIDIQHLWPVKILVELDIASKNLGGQKKNEIFQQAMHKAIRYTDEHFSTEELLMEKFGYPKFAEHKTRHKQFIDNLALRNKENKNNEPAAAFNLVQDLREWLLSHIALDDKSLRKFFTGKMSQVSSYIQELNTEGTLKIHGGEVDLYKEMKEKKLL